MPGQVRGLYAQSDSAGDRTGKVRMPMVRIGATYRIRLNRPCAAAMNKLSHCRRLVEVWQCYSTAFE